MPTRRLPKINKDRFNALKAAKDRKDMVPAPLIIPYSAPTIIRIDTAFAAYKPKMDAVDAALIAQGAATNLVKTTRRKAELHVIHFYDALQNAILRETFTEEIRAGYGLTINDANLPTVKSEADILFWGDKINTGETARVAAGGAPITFPSLAQVNTAVSNFLNANLLQANAKDAYDVAQEELEVLNPETDKVILKMWNETETTFDVGDKPSMRRKCREWGVIYVPIPGETPSPEDYSIMGTVTDSAGNPLDNAAVIINGTTVLETTGADGKYFIGVQPPGTYNITVYKGTYTPKNFGAVVVTAGAITTLNAVLDPAGPTGKVMGNVKLAGTNASAKITIEGLGEEVNTDAAGDFTFNDVPEGPQVVKAVLNSDPSVFQTQNITVVANTSVSVQFDF